jgi:acetylornithine/succinyldiaminopimelate/putrescine aminotransferase
MGLMLGVELDREGADLVACAMKKGLLINCTAGCVLRFMPSLRVTGQEVSKALGLFEEALKAQC